MNVLFSTYVQALNKQLARKGPLFEGRFKHINIEKDEYIIHLSRYIHLNPVNAGLVTAPDKWVFSNYRDWIGKRKGKLKDANFISFYFASPEKYEKFVMDHKIDTELRKRLEPYLLE